MVGEGTPALFITFLLAVAGYAGLTAVVLLSLGGEIPRLLWRTTVAVILTHVVLVWAYRYGWQFSLAVRNGYAGFLIFHTATGLLLLSTIARAHLARTLIRISFVIVTVGAVGAAFRYDAVSVYRAPVLLCAIAGNGGLLWKSILRNRIQVKTTSQ